MTDHKALLVAAGALVPGHFVYNSMLHGEWFVNKTAGLVLASHALAHADAIARHFADYQIEAVVGPELGAITLMADVRRRLFASASFDIAGVIATKIPGTDPTQFEIARDQARFIAGKRTLIVEDILTKGLNATATVKTTTDAGGIVVGAGVLWNRGAVAKETIGVPELFSCVNVEIETFTAEDCLQCRAGVPVNTDLGKGKKFLEEKGRAR